MTEELYYWVWLSCLTKTTSANRKQLVEYFGNPKKLWNASHKELINLPFITRKIYEQVIDCKVRESVEAHVERIDKMGIKILKIDDKSYPNCLKEIYDPPVVLYVKGSIKKEEKCIAVIGSRKATAYGYITAERLAKELTAYGFTIVSGMARGIDSYAHRGALKNGGRTIAVLGCGSDIVYPYENKKLMEDITNQGAVISEYLPGTPPVPYNFPLRNRIISGMCFGVVVVEANQRSGSLITAELALEQGREVFAVPGDINRMNSVGTNRLIRDGAKVVTCIDDILDELKIYNNVNNNEKIVNKNYRKFKLSSEEEEILECIKEQPLHIDIIAKKSGLNIKTVSTLLVMMELRGIVQQMPGKNFMLKY